MIYVVFLESFMNWVVWSFFFFFGEQQNPKIKATKQGGNFKTFKCEYDIS